MNSNQGVFLGLSSTAVAHGAALALLGTAFLLVASLLVAGVLLARGRRRHAALAAALAPAAGALYGAALLALSFTSRARVLDHAQEKYFCDLDCHLAYCVTDVSFTDTLANAALPPPRGRYCLVTVRARFDPTTTAPWRPRDVPVFPSPLELQLVDAGGRTLGVAADAQRALERAAAAGSSLARPLLPGASATSRFVFDLPEDFHPGLILLRNSEWFRRWALADESSWGHARTFWSF